MTSWKLLLWYFNSHAVGVRYCVRCRHNVIWLGFGKVESRLSQKNRTNRDSKPVKHLNTMQTVLMSKYDLLLLKYMFVFNIDTYWYRLWTVRENNKNYLLKKIRKKNNFWEFERYPPDGVRLYRKKRNVYFTSVSLEICPRSIAAGLRFFI